MAQLAWTVGIRSGPEIAAFSAGSMRLQRAMGAKMAGQMEATRTAALDLAAIITGELTGPLVEMLQRALGGSEDSADELLAAVIDVIDLEDPVRSRAHAGDGQMAREPSRFVGTLGGAGRAGRPVPPPAARAGVG